MSETTVDRQWEEAARATAALVRQFEDLGVPSHASEIWAGPFIADLANRYDGSQDVPLEVPRLVEACEARIPAEER